MTRLAPPPQQARLIQRPRVANLLSAAIDYPLTLVMAPPGSGKTTALASFAMHSGWNSAWCRMTPSDQPASLVLHLAAAFRPIIQLDEQHIRQELARTRMSAAAALDVLVNELATSLPDETFLILEEYQYADQDAELRRLIERLIDIQPASLHVLLSTRSEPTIGTFATVRARGEVLRIGQRDLSFTPDEMRELFILSGHNPPSETEIENLVAAYRGWPLALQMILTDWETIGASWSPESLHISYQALLDEYLLQQALDNQPLEVQHFLLHTAGLRWIDPDACTTFLNPIDVRTMIETVQQRYLFVEMLPGGVLRYQPLFQAFLNRLAARRLPNYRELHSRFAEHYQERDDSENAIYHLLEADDTERAAHLLATIADKWIAQNKGDALLTWLNRLPAEHRKRPALLEASATAYRQLGFFEYALRLYQEAEKAFLQEDNRDGRVRALRGQAEVYLDTVQPAPAVALLKQALKSLPKDRVVERADILRLQAENWANRGRADVALLLEKAAARLVESGAQRPASMVLSSAQPSDSSGAALLPPRLLLRSGRLIEARDQIEAWLGLRLPNQELSDTITEIASGSAAHREPLLLLALIYALLGNGARALAMARRGLLEAQQGKSQMTEAIALMRVGHAKQILSSTFAFDETTLHLYQQSLALVQRAGVIRTRAEVCLGLTLLYGHSGDLATAEVHAQEGIQIAEASGDTWIVAWTMVSIGGAAVSAGNERAHEWLDQALQRFVRGGDAYGEALVALWKTLAYTHSGAHQQRDECIIRLLTLVKQYGYESLLTAPTLYGPRDMAMLAQLLLRARALPEYMTFAQQLLRHGFPSIATDDTVEEYHPGYTLRVQMLGNFRVWRGWHEIQAREWQREKARQLFQLLLTYRGTWLQREQICAWLWPDSDLDAAERQFKVTLNALNAALEPQRPPRTAPFFIHRQGLAYSFAPSYGCWIDVDEFELRATGTLAQNDPEFARRSGQIAIQLYRGDYLAESLYDAWTLEERERLLARFLATATTHATRLADNGEFQDVIQLCEQVLRRDRCYEEAYQVLIRAHSRSGSRSQALRSYTRCVQALSEDLGIEPLPETTSLYERIKRNEQL